MLIRSEEQRLDFENIKQWMEMAKKYQSGDFWNSMLDQSSFNQFMKDNMDFGSSNNSFVNQTSKNEFPRIDIYMTDYDITVIADLPGFRKEDLHVSVSGIRLLLKGTSMPIVNGQLIRQERVHGQFERVIELPEPTESNQIRAKFRDGVLILTYKRIYRQEEWVNIE